MPTHLFPDHRHAPAPSRGFTLVEVMSVVLILLAMAALAVPSLSGIVERLRVRRASEDLMASLLLARTEAIRRGGNITLRKASSAACPEASNWSCGWLVFADANNDGAPDPGEQQIQASPAPQGVAVKMRIANPASHLKVNRWGRFNDTIGAFRVTLNPVGQEDSPSTIQLCMSSAGRLKSVQGAGLCD